MGRPTWDEYFMSIARSAAERSSCLSEAKGAAITVENRIVAIGYSGAPSGIYSCLQRGVCRKRELGFGHGEGHHQCLAVHAEANAILSAVRTGVKVDGGTIYCTHYPCEGCAKLIINAGIKHVVYSELYHSELTHYLFTQACITVTRLQLGSLEALA